MRVLVVEDESKVAGFLWQGLLEEGHGVDARPDGTAALETIADAAVEG